MNREIPDLTIREADLRDREEIWLWWNDRLTRQMMANNADVPWEDHCRWYDSVLTDPDRILCLGTIAGEKIGVIRFDLRAPDIYEVSINLRPEARGKGYAGVFMEQSICYLLSIRKVKKLLAGFKKINHPSMKTFLKAGFQLNELPTDHPSLRTFNPETELYCERTFS